MTGLGRAAGLDRGLSLSSWRGREGGRRLPLPGLSGDSEAVMPRVWGAIVMVNDGRMTGDADILGGHFCGYARSRSQI